MVLLTGFGLGCILLQILILMRDYWRLTVTRIYSALLVMAALLLLIPYMDEQWRWIAWDLATATPALFWLCCQIAFARAPQWYSSWSLIGFYSFLAPALARKSGVDLSPETILHLLLWELPRVCEYLLVLNGGWTMLRTWKDDKDPGRRRLRSLAMGIVGTGILGVSLGLNMGIASDLFIQVTVCACTISSAVLMLGRHSLFLTGDSGCVLPKAGISEEAACSSGASFDPAEQRSCSTGMPEWSSLARRLQALMCEGYYRTEGLTLKRLAQELDVPQHRLRTVINSEMGYRNFSEFINLQRMQEARARLRAEPDTPVLNIALDAGYRNISSFNRTFKELVGSTPTEYRKTAVIGLPLAELASVG